MSLLFPKVYSPFVRHTEGPLRNKLDVSNWSKPEFGLLACRGRGRRRSTARTSASCGTGTG
jgi:hypothetical protein